MMREKGGVLGGENLANREQKDALESLNEVGLLLRQQGTGRLPVGKSVIEQTTSSGPGSAVRTGLHVRAGKLSFQPVDCGSGVCFA